MMPEPRVRHILEGKFDVLNWNIGGAKYLELKSEDSKNRGHQESRESFRKRLNKALEDEINTRKPHVITLQEVVQYQRDKGLGANEYVIDPPAGYHYFPHMLIDTVRHSHPRKWNKVRKKGEWPDTAFFAQGNAVLIREDQDHFPILALPAINQDHDKWVRLKESGSGLPCQECMEVVELKSALYLGTRDTEPRAALLVHLILSHIGANPLPKPLDIFVINLHLTTLTLEREGNPAIDERAEKARLLQVDTVLNEIVSPYNEWRSREYKVEGVKLLNEEGRVETDKRFPPIWIITGDFNFAPESIELKTLERRGFISMVNDFTKAKGLGNPPSIQVDYIFVGPRFEAIDPQKAAGAQAAVDENANNNVSDHYPLFTGIPIIVELDNPRIPRNVATAHA
jgi:endonuclease/exonuclease/phosphatase family metal-dependent hydrolase